MEENVGNNLSHDRLIAEQGKDHDLIPIFQSSLPSCDANMKIRNFKLGDSPNVFTNPKSTPTGKILWSLCNREKKIDDLNYVVLTPDWHKKKRICHINMIKGYIEKNNSNIKPALMLTDNGKGNDPNQNGQSDMTDNREYIPHLKNSEIVGNIERKKKNIYLVVNNRIFLVWSVISEQFFLMCQGKLRLPCMTSRWVMRDPLNTPTT